MIKLQTRVDIKDIEKPISYQHKIMALGSCFVENMGGRMAELKYNMLINPFGIQYNPLSISTGLLRLLDAKAYQSSDLFQYNGLWHSFEHHGSFSGTDATEVLSDMNTRLQAAGQYLQETDLLLLTLGTSWVYRSVESTKVVNNCHKLPAAYFYRQRLSVAELINELKTPLHLIFEQNPGLSVLLTVSPIRHLKDGAAENQLSKATLLLAVEALQAQFSQINYFPAYEIMMDELRDYRFYARDLVHPNELAIDYIWERFETHFLNLEEKKLRIQIEKIMKAIRHRPLNPNTAQHEAFLEKCKVELLELNQAHPYLNFKEEIRYLSKHLENNNQ